MPPDWLWLVLSLQAPDEIRLPTGEGEWGAEDVALSRTIEVEGGETDLRVVNNVDDSKGAAEDEGAKDEVATNGAVDLMRDKGSAVGRDPAGGPMLLGEAAEDTGAAGGGLMVVEDEVRITAAAALGAEKLLRGTNGAWNTPKMTKKTHSIINLAIFLGGLPSEP
jgi:hypothetical protein